MTLIHKYNSQNRTKTVFLCPFVFTRNAPRKAKSGMSADLVETILLNKII